MRITSVPGEDQEARLKDWISRYSDDVLRTCYVMLADRALAEDAMQDTFVKVWRGMARFEGRNDASPRTWIMRIAINTCKDYRRTAWMRRRAQTKPLEDLPDAAAPVSGVARELFLSVLALPDAYKQVVLLYHYQGLTMEETARALGVSRQAVGRRLQKAYALLRAALEGGTEIETGHD